MKKFLVFLCAVPLVFGVVVSASASVPTGFIEAYDIWDEVGGNWHEYYVITLPGASWDNATVDMNILLGSGFHLATITSNEEQAFIESLLDDNGISGEYWLGGVQDPIDTLIADENWTWVTGEEFTTYQHWWGTEPNDNYGPGSEQHLAMWSADEWYWNDQSALGNITGYIAESYESIPEPATMLLIGSGLIGLAGLGRKKLFKRG